MIYGIRHAVARWLSPEREQELEDYEIELLKREKDMDLEINNRVAEITLKMDPFEPFLKKHNVIFGRDWIHPEDNLDSVSQLRMFMWAYGMIDEPSFKYITNWIINTQGNNTLRKAQSDAEWFYGRSAIVTIGLFVDEVGRLASRYKEIRAREENRFDENLTVE